jgi:hypothetical protein
VKTFKSVACWTILVWYYLFLVVCVMHAQDEQINLLNTTTTPTTINDAVYRPADNNNDKPTCDENDNTGILR